jgi:hypothetical protein
MTNASRRQRGFGIVGALDQEWRELVGMHSEAVMGWAVRHAVLAPYKSLDDVLSAARQPSDAVLSALLAEVSRGPLAGRVVLQARSAGSHGWRNATRGPASMTTWWRSGR